MEIRLLDEKIQNVEGKVRRLIEQNNQLRKMCLDLVEERNQLETENNSLRNLLENKDLTVGNLETKVVAQSEKHQQEQNSIKEELQQYIQQLDQHLAWLETL